MFCDVVEGVVVIPLDLLDDVIKVLAEHVNAEEGIRYAVKNGMPVSQAFSLWR